MIPKNKETHTPGPWKLEVGEQCCFHSGNRVSVVAIGKDDDEDTASTVAEIWPTVGDSDIADGRLIAAAPELLEALRDAEKLIDGPIADLLTGDSMHDSGAYDVLSIIRDAIDKATI